MKDKLIELLITTPPMRLKAVGRAIGKTFTTASHMADHLISNGVMEVSNSAEETRSSKLFSSPSSSRILKLWTVWKRPSEETTASDLREDNLGGDRYVDMGSKVCQVSILSRKQLQQNRL